MGNMHVGRNIARQSAVDLVRIESSPVSSRKYIHPGRTDGHVRAEVRGRVCDVLVDPLGQLCPLVGSSKPLQQVHVSNVGTARTLEYAETIAGLLLTRSAKTMSP